MLNAKLFHRNHMNILKGKKICKNFFVIKLKEFLFQTIWMPSTMAASTSSQKKFQNQQEKNGLKVRTLDEITDKYLLNIFHKHFPRDPKLLCQELSLPKNKTKLDDLKNKKKILKKDQYQLLFPSSRETLSERFDTTLTFLLIRNLCGYKEPSTGWDTEPNGDNLSEIAQAIRLKLERNKSRHGRLPIATSEYKDIYNRRMKPLLELGCPKDELSDLMPTFQYDIPKETKDFIGRHNEINKIAKIFDIYQMTAATNSQSNATTSNQSNSITASQSNATTSNQSNSTTTSQSNAATSNQSNSTTTSQSNATTSNQSNVVITGIPGTGKSELANMFYHKHTSFFDHVIWINMDNKDLALSNIAKILQFHDTSNNKIIAHLLKDYFKGENILCIFDNCTHIESYLLDITKYNIITTQTQHWNQSSYDVIKLQTWPQQIAWNFINNTIANADQEEVKKLAIELGNHPLGIKHATSFINQTNISLNEYLSDLKDHKIDVLSERVAIGYGIPVSVFSSFSITIEKLHQENADQAKLMNLLGVLDGSFIYDEFLQRFTDDNLEYKKSLRLLEKHSIVHIQQRKKEFNKNKNEKFITVHSLYQEAIKIYLINKNIVKTTIKYCLKMMTHHPFETIFFRERKLWERQLEYLWKQKCYENIIIDFLSNFPEIRILEFLPSSTQISILEMIYESRKNDKSDIISYYAEWMLNEMIPVGESILKRLNENNVPASEGKENLVILIKMYHHAFRDGNISSFLQGHYNDIRDIYDKKSLVEIKDKFELMFPDMLTELGRYDEALDFLYSDPIYEDEKSLPVKIGCCKILKGDIEEGMKIIEKVSEIENDLKLITYVARALFRVERIEQSKKYFEQILSFGRCPCRHFYTDAICMAMQILHVEDHLFLDCIRFCNEYNSTMLVRWEILFFCNLVKQHKFMKAEYFADYAISKRIEAKQYTGHLFREALIMADRWLNNRWYVEALIVFKMINKFKEMVCNHEGIIEPIDMTSLDVQDKVNLCTRKLKVLMTTNVY